LARRHTANCRMPPKRRRIREDEDDLAWETSEKVFDTWEVTLYSEAIRLSITSFILKYRKGEAAQLHTPIMGGCNILWRLEYKDGSSVGLRVPAKGTFTVRNAIERKPTDLC
jgi:hypothetical protein